MVNKMQKILITGFPRVGKTTLINNLIVNLNKSAVGLITNEIREKGKRIGFNIMTLSGLEYPLASKLNHSSKYRVSSYGVYVENIDKIINQLELEMQNSDYDIVIIDEIGRMELFSGPFKRFLENCLDTKEVLGSIMLNDNQYTKRIKERSDTVLFHLTRENRLVLEKKIMEMLQ